MRSGDRILTSTEESAPPALLSFLKGQDPIPVATRDDGPTRKRRKTGGGGLESQANTFSAKDYLTLARADVEIVRLLDFAAREDLLIVLLGLSRQLCIS